MESSQEYCITEFLRMSGVYWGLTSMFLMNKQEMMDKDDVIEFVKSCQHENGGFSASHNHDPHLLYTLSAIQVCERLSVFSYPMVNGQVLTISAGVYKLRFL